MPLPVELFNLIFKTAGSPINLLSKRCNFNPIIMSVQEKMSNTEFKNNKRDTLHDLNPFSWQKLTDTLLRDSNKMNLPDLLTVGALFSHPKCVYSWAVNEKGFTDSCWFLYSKYYRSGEGIYEHSKNLGLVWENFNCILRLVGQKYEISVLRNKGLSPMSKGKMNIWPNL